MPDLLHKPVHSGGRGSLHARASLLVAGVLALLTLAPLPLSAAPASRPAMVKPPTRVSARAGASGTVAIVRWSPSFGASGYRVWRSTRRNVGFEPIGSTASTGFSDASGIPGRTYYYQVTAMLPGGQESAASTISAGVSADWTESPHATYGKGNLCMTCHALHRGDADAERLGRGEIAICESCHDGQGARTNVKDGPDDSFGLASGHRVEEATRGADLTNECSSCHSPHADPRKRLGLYRKKVAGRAVSGGNAWCGACHDDTSSWSPGYPALGAPRRDAAGYPVLGTYPGPMVYAGTAKSGHAGIAAGQGRPQGDCLLCHAAHRSPNRYDGLLLTFAPPTPSTVASDQVTGGYAALCFQCHAGAPEWTKQGAADIRRYVTRQTGRAYAPHSIVTSGGTLPVGAPIPCYDCHNPHGSSRGNASLISDALGRDLSTASDEQVRAFCLSCHSTSDGKAWDSVRGRYADVPAGAKFEGLRRDGADGSLLRLGEVAEAAHAATDETSCYDCHGSDYSGADSPNVHAPKRMGATAFSTPAPTAAPSQDKTGTPPAARRGR